MLVSPSREELYPLVTIMAMNRDLSDHTPLLISICEFAHIPKQFKFENCWLIRSELKVIVSNTWKQDFRGETSLDKWKNRNREMRKKLRDWNKNYESDIKKQKKYLALEFDRLNKLGELGGFSADDWLYQRQCRLILKAILKEEGVKWIQRSREKELLERDDNTIYYHAKANGS
jgi:hypothetical protein